MQEGFGTKPGFVLDELANEHPKRINLGRGLVFHYRVSRPKRMAYGEAPVLKSMMSGLLWEGGQIIGALIMTRYNVEHCYDDQAFIWAMDAEDEHQYQLARTIANAWNAVHDLADCGGTIITIEGVWIDQRCGGRALLSRCLPRISTVVFPDFCVLVFKARPLEELSEGAMARRTRAMMRLYQRMGAKTLPGDAGDEGWMWAPRPFWYIPEPSSEPLQDGKHLCQTKEVDLYC
jgi:hypothetical protein